MLYPRKVLEILRKQKETKEIIVLTGMRRTGKTSILRMLFDEIKSENKIFLDIENPIEQKIFEEMDFNNIWENFKQYNINPSERVYVFLDEIQTMPEIVKAVKYLYDHYNIKFFLTGSSSFYLKNLFPESLAGRKFVFELFPLDFEEFLIFKNIKKNFYEKFSDKSKNKNAIQYEKLKKLYEEYVMYGGFPQVVLKEIMSEKNLALIDIFKSYFEKDIQILSDFRDINAFRDLILLLAKRAGAKLDISKLSSEVGISRETVYSYLSFLQQTYFLTLVSPFTTNIDREVSGAKKVYFCDTGIISSIVDIEKGSLFENAVFNNLRKYGGINYYQKRNGVEIDFVLNKQVGIEVKKKGTTRDIIKLKMLSGSLSLKESYIVTKEFVKGDHFIPALEL